MNIDSLTIPVVTHNLHGPDKNPDRRHTTIRKFLDMSRGGLGGFNELNPKDRAYLKSEAAKRDLNVYIGGLNGIVWAPAVVKKRKIRLKKIMTGGHVGADGVATPQKGDDDRRVGPSRFAAYGEFELVMGSDPFEFDVTHLMARAFTAHRWRIPLWRRSVVSLADGVQCNRGVMIGDMNTNNGVDLAGIPDRAVNIPATMGHQHYDQMREWGNLNVHSTVTFEDPSDHKGVRGLLTIPVNHDGSAIPSDPAKPSKPAPKPRTVKRLPKPVRHPWAKRSRRWKLRHPVKWRKIVAWRKQNRR